MEFKLLRHGEGLSRREDFIARARRVSVEIILHEPDGFRLGIVAGEQRLHEFGIVTRGAAFADLPRAKARVGLNRQEHTTRPVLLVFIMIPLRFAGTQGQTSPDLGNQKARPFIEAEERMADVVGERVVREAIFPMSDILAGNIAHTPVLTYPGLEFVFFSTRRTLS